MFSDEPMPVDVLCALLPMADQPGWNQKWGIVTWIATFPEGRWVEGGDAAQLLGSAEGRARMHLLDLTKARVLERDGLKGGRRFWYRLNPRWKEWRIDWHYDHRGIEMRLAHWEKARAVPPLIALSARPNGARYARISARLMARATADEAAKNGATEPRSARPMARATGTVGSPQRAPQGARYRNGQRAVQGRALNEGESKEEEEDLVREPSSSGDGATDAAEAGEAVSEVDRGAVRQEVLIKCRSHNGKRPWLAGRPAQALDELIDRYGDEDVRQAVASIPEGEYLAPEVVDLLAFTLKAGQQPALPGIDDDPGVDLAAGLRGRLKELEALIADVEAGGYEAPGYMTDERNEITARLAAFEAESYDRPDG